MTPATGRARPGNSLVPPGGTTRVRDSSPDPRQENGETQDQRGVVQSRRESRRRTEAEPCKERGRGQIGERETGRESCRRPRRPAFPRNPSTIPCSPVSCFLTHAFFPGLLSVPVRAPSPLVEIKPYLVLRVLSASRGRERESIRSSQIGRMCGAIWERVSF